MRRIIGFVLILWLVTALLAACGTDDPPVTSDRPVLSGFESLPKQIATVALTPTPTAVVAGSQIVSVAQPTATSGRPQPTPTLTPYVGIFLGDLGGEEGEEIPTLAPYVVNPFGTGGIISSGNPAIAPGMNSGPCSIPVAGAISAAFNARPDLQQTLGCPVTSGASLQLVSQPFERGFMIWRDTRQIYALATNNQFWQVADLWDESMPADDPGFAPPGGLLQPVRGFGLAWRSNQSVRDALGWGVSPEAPYGSFWQDFEGGALFVGADGRTYAIFPGQGQHSGPL